jgi:hypothetical protein
MRKASSKELRSALQEEEALELKFKKDGQDALWQRALGQAQFVATPELRA